ncbi:Ganglioside-induced differentiation-associated protein 2 [Rhynchospora pubera]|uniref:Ganglioside-induced differentiation-associated protein 2 n=1 Tax=Rhynchospora pubera TaxID=906938 RepID=A0AAV8EJP9_9POAL|nr:Ganglioside-induced differentiation-associated protein 2 [Rhynchospora pubera]KAJ4804776.1 Ganglioside-induced differentiation-associated protein 2 [Rhynchospora pubera]
MAMREASDDLSVVVLASDLGVDGRTLLSPSERRLAEEESGEATWQWHDCMEEDFSDLEQLQFLRLQGSDKAGNRILRIVGKFFPAPVVTVERLKRYVTQKINMDLAEGPFCIVYMHSKVQSGDNNPGMSVLRWIYEDLPSHFKDRLKVVYFLHPGIRSRLAMATLGRWFLTGGLYWKIKYVSRIEYLWEDIRKGQVEIPEIVSEHDEVLEHRPLTDYGIEPDTLHFSEVPTIRHAQDRYGDKWSRDFM